MTRQQKLAAILLRLPGINAKAQRNRLIAAMCETGHVTTFEAMRVLDVFDPRPRIFELRAEGHSIKTVMRAEQTESGVLHRVGVYFLTEAATE